MRLSEIQMRILIVLTWELRAGSDGQLASRFGLTLKRFRRLADRLRTLGLLTSWRTTALSHDMQRPLASYERGDELPDFSAIAWQLRKRWLSATRIPVRVYWATSAAAHIVGGVGGPLKRPLQLQHDLGVAEIWARRTPEPEQKWISEDIFRSWYLREAKAKVPDALLVDERDNQVKRVLEYGGQYSRQRLAEFHRYWASRAPYEIW